MFVRDTGGMDKLVCPCFLVTDIAKDFVNFAREKIKWFTCKIGQ